MSYIISVESLSGLFTIVTLIAFAVSNEQINKELDKIPDLHYYREKLSKYSKSWYIRKLLIFSILYFFINNVYISVSLGLVIVLIQETTSYKYNI